MSKFACVLALTLAVPFASAFADEAKPATTEPSAPAATEAESAAVPPADAAAATDAKTK